MIIVFGSINIDLLLPVDHYPVPGQMMLGKPYAMEPGGKGANQALAAARTGAKTALVGCVGDDGPGMRILNGLKREGVLVSGVAHSTHPTGLVVILNDDAGQCGSILATSANNDARNDQIPDELLTPANMILMQAEILLPENWAMIKRAHKKGAKTMLNLAPYAKPSLDALKLLDYLIVNQQEARELANLLQIPASKDEAQIAQTLTLAFGLHCIITLGGDGSLASTPQRELIRVGAYPIETVVDALGAGDAYCGTLAAMLNAGKELSVAMQLASAAGSLACLKPGAQSSYPYLSDIQDAAKLIPEPVITKF